MQENHPCPAMIVMFIFLGTKGPECYSSLFLDLRDDLINKLDITRIAPLEFNFERGPR